MEFFEIKSSLVKFIPNTGDLLGESIKYTSRKITDLKNVFADEAARENLSQDTLVYEVQAYYPVKENKEGGLFFGNSTVHPGKVGNEYFMTRGHFHEKKDTAEFYWCISGEGALIFMDETRNTWAEKMIAGSLHYIPGKVAHRVANTCNSILRFGACWPSDAGHDYATIAELGFSARLIEKDGKPKLIKA